MNDELVKKDLLNYINIFTTIQSLDFTSNFAVDYSCAVVYLIDQNQLVASLAPSLFPARVAIPFLSRGSRLRHWSRHGHGHGLWTPRSRHPAVARHPAV